MRNRKITAFWCNCWIWKQYWDLDRLCSKMSPDTAISSGRSDECIASVGAEGFYYFCKTPYSLFSFHCDLLEKISRVCTNPNLFLGFLKLGQFSINELQTLGISSRRQLGNICSKYSWCWGAFSNLIIVQGLAALLMRHWPGSSSPFCHYLPSGT